MGGLQQHLAAEARGPALALELLDRLGREALRPGASALGVDERDHLARVVGEERLGLALLGPGLGGIDREIGVRRAHEDLGAARDQDEAGLAQAVAQRQALLRRAGGVGHLDIVADDHVRPAAGDVAGDAARQDRRVALRQAAAHGELVGRPGLVAARPQVPRQQVLLDDLAHVARHLLGKLALGREDQDPQVGVPGQQPGAVEAHQRRLAGIAKHHEQEAGQALLARRLEPEGDLEMQPGRRAALLPVPGADEAREGDLVIGADRALPTRARAARHIATRHVGSRVPGGSGGSVEQAAA